MTLVKDGQIVLDGTLSKQEKEKIVFKAYEKHLEVFELIRDYQIDFYIIDNSVGNYDDYVSRMREFYDKNVINKTSWEEWKEQWVLEYEDFMKVWETIYELERTY